MSRLEELIQELCPDGVEYNFLGNVCEIRSGWGFPKTEQGRKKGDFPFYKVGDMNLPGNEHFMTNSDNYINADVSKKLGCNPAPEGTIIFPKIGAAIGTNKKRMLTVSSCYDNNVMGIISGEKIIPGFLFYIFDSLDLMRFADYSGAMPSIRKSTMEKYLIPVPPLEVQREIVRILDNFTELTAELTVELTARRQQYEYYRDKLLTYTDYSKQYRVVPLGSVADIGDGLHGTPNYDDKSEYYFVNGNNIKDGRIHITENTKCVSDEDYNKYNILFDENTLFMSINGTIGNVGKYNGESIVLGKSIAYFNVYPEELYSRYLFHYLQSSESKKYYTSVVTGGTIKNLGLKALRNYSIVLPNIEIQKEISSILDNFESICSDLTSGLPAEIEARQKQFEYYRDKLLTFKEKVA